jgi:hypothetical protein
MRNTLTLILLLGLFFMTAASAQELVNSPALHVRATGYAGSKSATYLVFEKALQQGAESRPLYLKCLAEGTPAAKLYGALGLYALNRADGQEALRWLSKDDSKVPFMSGCLLSEEQVSRLAEELLSDEPNTLSVRSFLPQRD